MQLTFDMLAGVSPQSVDNRPAGAEEGALFADILGAQRNASTLQSFKPVSGTEVATGSGLPGGTGVAEEPAHLLNGPPISSAPETKANAFADTLIIGSETSGDTSVIVVDGAQQSVMTAPQSVTKETPVSSWAPSQAAATAARAYDVVANRLLHEEFPLATPKPATGLVAVRGQQIVPAADITTAVETDSQASEASSRTPQPESVVRKADTAHLATAFGQEADAATAVNLNGQTQTQIVSAQTLSEPAQTSGHAAPTSQDANSGEEAVVRANPFPTQTTNPVNLVPAVTQQASLLPEMAQQVVSATGTSRSDTQSDLVVMREGSKPARQGSVQPSGSAPVQSENATSAPSGRPAPQPTVQNASNGVVAKEGNGGSEPDFSSEFADLLTDTPEEAVQTQTVRTDARTVEAAAQNALRQSPGAHLAAMVSRVGEQILERFSGKTSTFEIRLDPPELGKVDVRVEVGADGKVMAVLAARDPSVVDALMRGARTLENALTQAGISLADGGVQVQLDQRNSSGFAGTRGGNGAPQNSGAQASSGDPLAEASDDMPITPVIQTWSRHRLDLTA